MSALAKRHSGMIALAATAELSHRSDKGGSHRFERRQPEHRLARLDT